MKPKTSFVSVTDQFCGAGGSSLGAVSAGAEVVLAMNHWQRAIETHNTNFPNTIHVQADTSQVDPRTYPTTDILITSPECTNHSLAKGKKRKNLGQLELWGNHRIDPAEERSRATMWDVPRFAEFHNYNIVIVENVVDARCWRLFDSWIHAMHALGYDHEIVYFNSMFAYPTPQSRDRMYVVFWKAGNRKPNLDFRPLAYCPACEKDVEAVQTWKKHKWGRYEKQYTYNCPHGHGVVNPYFHPAATAIDWGLPAERIGDRKRPLKPRTMERIQRGLEKYGRETMIFPVDYTHSNSDCTRAAWLDALPTQTTRQVMAMAFIQSYYTRQNTSWPVSEALATVTGENRHSLVIPPFISSYYGNETSNSALEAIRTQTTKPRHALVYPADNLRVEDCHFRMLQPHEIGRAMAFPDDYVVLGSQRDKVKQYGNAVTPPVMRQILSRCIESLHQGAAD